MVEYLREDLVDEGVDFDGGGDDACFCCFVEAGVFYFLLTNLAYLSRSHLEKGEGGGSNILISTLKLID